jgi:hypothetical protein
MRSTANGAARQATARAAIIRPRRSIATVLAATSASGAAQPPTAPAATTAQPASTRSEGAEDYQIQWCINGEVRDDRRGKE